MAGNSGSMKGLIMAGKVLLCPVILIVQAVRIYFIGCLGAYVERFGRGLLCGLCVCCNCTYKDKKFPANSAAIGAWKNKTPAQVDQEIKWRRVEDICATGGKTGAKLFSGEVEPADICQGQLGDCWLMSALACLAKHEGAIQQCFLTSEFNAYGRYRIKLFDRPHERWVKVAIDDWIPVDAKTGHPVFAKPNGDEAWVLLLEKSMAKFKGSYAALDGGSSLWALEALTGDYVFKLKLDDATKRWKRYEMVHQPKAGKTNEYDIMLRDCNDPLTLEETFKTMLFYKRKRSVIAASTGGGDDTQSTNGIVHGHAYSLINVKEVAGFQLVQLRNPWGTFEWQGNWSDSSPLWTQNPKVAKALNFTQSNDGSFWMDWKDFQTYFKNLDFCCRTTGWDDLTIDLHEDSPICGPTWGCIEGCFKYWLCCKGVRALFCARKQSGFEKAEATCC